MKQLINKWLKNSQLFNYGDSLSYLKQAIFKQNCILCAANISEHNSKISPNHVRAENDALQANTQAVCRACLEDLPWHPANSCPQCGLESSAMVCGSCLNSPPDFDAAHAVFLYQFPIDAMMQRFKYGNSLNIGDSFGQFLSKKINLVSSNLNHIDVVIPMPMHPARIKARGFNQALEIAKVLTKNCKEKLDFKSVERIILTPPQASLPLKERVKNIKGAFKVKADKPDKIQGKRIAIVDDVMTSGASLNELAKTLKEAGAAHVECWVVARTLPHK